MIIEISNLSFEAIIGLLPKERKKPQRVSVDVILEYDYPCIDCDGGYIDYAKVVDIIKADIIHNRYLVLEDAIYNLKIKLTDIYPQIKRLEISVAKPDILPECLVKVRGNFKF